MTEAIDGLRSIRRHPAARIGSTVLFVLVVVPFLVYSFPMAVGADGSFVVLSGSMEPTIGVGDVIVVDDVDPGNVEEGDIITFRRAGDEVPTTHRVIDVREVDDRIEFTTKGDANEDPDAAPVTGDQVVGRVVGIDVPAFGTALFVVPFIGYVIRTLGTTHGFVVFFAVPFTLLLASEVRDFARDSVGAGTGESGAGAGGAEAGSDSDGTGLARAGSVTAGGDPGEPSPAAGGDPAGDDGTYTFTLSELRLALVVLGLFIAYSLVVANEVRTVWSVMVSAGAAMAALLTGILYLSADTVDDGDASGSVAASDGGASAPPGTGAEVDAGRFVPGSIPPGDERGTTVAVGSLDALVDMAAADRRWIVEDGGTYAVFGPGVTYIYADAPGNDAASSGPTGPWASELFDGATDGGTAEPTPDRGGRNGLEGDDDG